MRRPGEDVAEVPGPRERYIAQVENRGSCRRGCRRGSSQVRRMSRSCLERRSRGIVFAGRSRLSVRAFPAVGAVRGSDLCSGSLGRSDVGIGLHREDGDVGMAPGLDLMALATKSLDAGVGNRAG